MKNYAIGIDVGGTTCKMGLFTVAGEIVWKGEIPTDKSNDGANILRDLAAKIDSILAENHVDRDDVNGIGIGVPGPVSPDGVVNRCVNVGWGVVPLEKDFSEITGLPVKAGNDANVAALGESWMGSAKDYNSSLMVTLGTGVGGGLIINKKIVTGYTGAAAEIGHIVVNRDEKEACNCGLHGCLEQYSSATGVVRLGHRHANATDKATKLKEVEEFSAKDLFDFAKAGDEVALETVEEFSDYLGWGLASVCAVANPDVIVLGGGVSKNGPIVTETLEKYFKKYAFHACRDTKIVIASLSNDAGIYGAAKLAVDL